VFSYGGWGGVSCLQVTKKLSLGDSLRDTDFMEYLLEDSYPKGVMAWHRKTMVNRRIRNQNDVAAYLIDLAIAPVAAEMTDQRIATYIAREFHALKSTSSRTMCKRTAAGFGRS